MNEEQVKAAAEKYAQVTRLPKLGMLGQTLYEADHPYLLSTRQSKMDAFEAGAAYAKGEIRKGDICPACATEFEDGTFKKCGGTIIKEVTFLRDEITRLKRVIARELVEEDGLGMEFTYVVALKEECERLREAWNKIDNLAQTLLDDGHERSPD